MKDVLAYFHSYVFALLRPSKVHAWLKHGIAPWVALELPPRPELVPSIGVSWAMAIVQGLSKIALAGILLKLLIQFQIDSGWDFATVDSTGQLIPYYFLVVSTALDLVFFPIVALVVTQFWNFVIRGFAWMLGIEAEERQHIAEQVTVVALSSNFLLVLPIAGVVLQKLAWLYLMYRGLRENLGVGRALSLVILITPTVVMLMLLLSVVLVALAAVKGMF